MDLLRTILIYMSMVFVSAVQSAPEPALMPELNAPSQTAYVEASATPTLVPTPSPTPVPTPDITPNSDYKTIRVGDNGDEVRNMQQKLADLGYYTGDVDGRFGNQTRRAVEKFQYN
ncbi:MAG: peptidoglycan-binding domain-containing protein, partial [Clostridia bacterium]